jgi:transposase
MDTTIATPASCEVRAVIHFLHAEGQSTAKIHHRLCRVYGDNVMSNSCVREWCRKFRDGRTDVHDGGQGRDSIVTDELIQKVYQCVRGKCHFTISELSEEFKIWGLLCIELSRTDWITISSVHGGYQNNWLIFTQNSKNGVSLDVSSALLGRGGQISWQNCGWWRDLGIICECRDERAV